MTRENPQSVSGPAPLGHAWFGSVPSHWTIAPLSSRYEVALGKMLDTQRFTGEYPGGYLRNVDVQWDSVNSEDLPEMDFAPSERSRYLLRPGDLLVCEGGEVGRTAVWLGQVPECFYQKAIHRVRPRASGEVPRFLYYLMRMMAAGKVFASNGNPNTIDHLTAVDLRHYRMPFPPPAEQRAIVSFLDRTTKRIDGLITKKERLLELLQERRAAVIARAVTKGLVPSVLVKTSGVDWLGEMPAHWAPARLKTCVSKVMSGGTPESDNAEYWSADESGIPWVAISDMTRSYRVANTAKRITERGIQSKRLAVLPAGTLLYSMYASLGKVAVLDIDAVVNQAILGLFPRDELVLRDFLRWWLEFIQGHTKMLSSSNTQDNLNADVVRNMPVFLPPRAEQQQLAAYLTSESEEIDALSVMTRKAIARLGELRSATISMAVTGKIDVRSAAE